MTTTPPPASPEPTPPPAAAQTPPAYQQSPYQQPGYAAQAKWNVLSIVTLVLGIIGLGIVPVITGFVSLSQIKKSGEQGRVLAIIGIILGFLAAIAWTIILIVWIGLIATAASSGLY